PGQKISRQRLIVERRSQTAAGERRHLMATKFSRVARAGDFYARRQDVNQVAGLCAKLAAGFNSRGPMGDERRADAAFMAIMLIQTPGSVAGVGPAGAV